MRSDDRKSRLYDWRDGPDGFGAIEQHEPSAVARTCITLLCLGACGFLFCVGLWLLRML